MILFGLLSTLVIIVLFYFKSRNYTPALGIHFFTRFYDLIIRLTMPEKHIRKHLILELAPQKNEKILEFGFGTGQNILYAYQIEPGAEYHGLDIDPEVKHISTKKFTEKNVSAKLHLYDGVTFPFENDSFDKVFSSLVFHHLKTHQKKVYLAEISRVLKSNGKLVIGDWGVSSHFGMRLGFILVQLIDGFKTTSDNIRGKLPEFISGSTLSHVKETFHIDTYLGSYRYYSAKKN